MPSSIVEIDIDTGNKSRKKKDTKYSDLKIQNLIQGDKNEIHRSKGS
jgi:hypothetical protein